MLMLTPIHRNGSAQSASTGNNGSDSSANFADASEDTGLK